MTKLSTLIVSVQNKPGVLFRIAGLIRRRQFNIESLTVSHTEKEGVSRFTILVPGDSSIVDKMKKQLDRLIEILRIDTPEEIEIVARELSLIKVAVKDSAEKDAVMELARACGAKFVHEGDGYVIFEISGTEEVIDGFYERLKKYGVLEFVRTGRTALFK